MGAHFTAGEESIEFIFTDAAGDPFSELIDALICLRKSVSFERTIKFLEEPGFIDLTINKLSSNESTITIHRQGPKPGFSYTAPCGVILLGFWRGLRLLQENFKQGKVTNWCNGRARPFENLNELTLTD